MRSTSGQSISLPNNIAFGCGYDNVGVYNYDASGVIGLGGTSTSLINQMSSLTGGKFSHCIAPKTQSSKMHFGAKAIVSGVGVVSAKMKISKNGFYKLKLKGLSVGNKRFSVSSKFLCSSTDIVIDSGAVVTYLPQKLYASLEASMEKEIGRLPIADPRGDLRLCYKISDKISPPIVTIHFSHADLKLEMRNTFIQVRDNIICLAFSPEYEPIFGSRAQENFLVGYDLRKKTIYFKPTDCTKQ
ncbi:hypothetical protein ACJIZ3_007607 [Penstemon smallii]|uniref:Peptidase A1 domain-containing protein n=1 Tax=Penstemon smallii TaxID=265156 RepID=A0ABD3T8C7_9LAMI